MATHQAEAGDRKPKRRSLAVRKAAAEAAVAASEKTGRPVDPRVKKLAESR
jgi:hypothetical protein